MGDSTYEGGAATPTAGALARQRALTERLLLTALNERDVSTAAVEASRRAAFLAAASRDLAQSLDDASTREMVQRRGLLREDSWCIVDIIELDGETHRLPVMHPDPAQQRHAQAFADRWFPQPSGRDGETSAPRREGAVADRETRARLRALGFGHLVVVPLVVRSRVIGAITFVTRADDAPFSAEEVTLASGLADLCALALDNSRLYREAQSSRALAEAADHAKSVFLANMSHELLTPLNAIGGYVALIQMGLRGPVTEQQRSDLARIQHNQAHLITLIANILSFVQTERAGVVYRRDMVPARVALTEVAEMLRGLVDERGLALAEPTAADDLWMWADADRVRQVLLNLMMNAVKYGSSNGGRITLESTATDDVVSLHVVDTGPGIPPDKHAAIFEPFVQLAGGLSDRGSGVGLGLAISRDLARAMHGDLTVESAVGVGSRFTLSLPRAVGPASPVDSRNAH